MKILFTLGLLFTCMAGSSSYALEVSEHDKIKAQKSDSVLNNKKWTSGSENCTIKPPPALEVFRFDQTTFVLRQSKCLSYEAPFIYVLFGTNTVLVLDTGATEDADDFPLYETVQSLIKIQLDQGYTTASDILVIHSHSHGDHKAADSQFRGKANVTLVETKRKPFIKYFGFDHWPDDIKYIDLGGRKLSLIPSPGHQEESLTIYDPQTKWLLTGDSLYPGFIYVKNWQDYKASITRLVNFSQDHEIRAILGSHIEMTAEPGIAYPVGTIYQPNEAALTLSPDSLVMLHSVLQKSTKPEELIFDGFIIKPMNSFQKMLSGIARLFTK